MKKLLFLLLLPSLALADDILSTAYNAEKDYNVCLRESDGDFINSVDFTSGDCASSACCQVSLDGAALGDCDNQPTALSSGCYNFTASAAELAAAQTKYYLVDAATSKRFVDKAVSFLTYGNASAWHGANPNVTVADIEQAALAKFSTTDTGETVPVAGSVAQLAKAATPTNFDTLLINASGHLSRVTLVDTTTNNTDMRGTDNAAPASDLTAVKNKTDQLVFTTANKLDTRVDYVGGTEVTGPNDLKATEVSIGANGIDADSIDSTAAIKQAVFNARVSTATIEAASYTGLPAETFYSLYGAMSQLVHKFTTVDGAWNVYKSDNTTILNTRDVTTSGSAQPVTGAN